MLLPYKVGWYSTHHTCISQMQLPVVEYGIFSKSDSTSVEKIRKIKLLKKFFFEHFFFLVNKSKVMDQLVWATDHVFVYTSEAIWSHCITGNQSESLVCLWQTLLALKRSFLAPLARLALRARCLIRKPHKTESLTKAMDQQKL